MDESIDQLRASDPRKLWKYKYPKVNIVNRNEFYTKLCKDKSVLHVGCTDHRNLIDIKIADNSYLHIKLMKVARIIQGIDLNIEAISYLKEKHNIDNIYAYDVTEQKAPNDLLKDYDIILISEVIEHVNNLGLFLTSVKKFMRKDSLLVIGTINANRLHNFITSIKGYEEVNPDHKYYFTYVTLNSLLKDCGFAPEKWHIYIDGDPSRKIFKYGIKGMKVLFKSIFLSICPWFGEGIIVQLKVKE